MWGPFRFHHRHHHRRHSTTTINASWNVAESAMKMWTQKLRYTHTNSPTVGVIVQHVFAQAGIDNRLILYGTENRSKREHNGINDAIDLLFLTKLHHICDSHWINSYAFLCACAYLSSCSSSDFGSEYTTSVTRKTKQGERGRVNKVWMPLVP